MKICCTCKEAKSLLEYGNRKTSIDGKQPYCKSCSAIKDKRHYRSSPIRRTNIRANNDVRIAISRAYVISYLHDKCCVDCGESDIVVLQFDHIDKKSWDISVMISRGISIEKISNEISKCEIRCANCHTRKTAKQFGWWKLLDKHKG